MPRPRVVYLAAAAIPVAILAWLFWRPSPIPPRAFLAPPAGKEFDGPVAISPDGKWLAGAVSDQGGRSLAVIDFAGRKGHQFEGTEGADLPFWSPDGRSIGFFAQGQLKTVETASRKVTAVSAAPGAKGGTWGREGAIVFAPSGDGPLYRVSAGGTPVPVTALDAARGETSHRWPQFLPDGHFLYSALSGSGDEAEIYVASPGGRAQARHASARKGRVHSRGRRRPGVFQGRPAALGALRSQPMGR